MNEFNTNELYHHGILGQKWGIRRYQNKDGTLTSAGKKRKSAISSDAAEANEIRKKKVSEMSNVELRKLNDRQNLERQYNNLNPTTLKKAIKFTASTAATMGTVMNLYNNSDKLVSTGRKVGSKIIDKLGNVVIKDLNKHL